MNLHFEDRQKLRALARPVEPQRDLWPQIAARIETAPRGRRPLPGWLATAASLAGVAILSAAIGFGIMHSAGAPHTADAPAQDAARMASTGNGVPSWNPHDPRLRGAAVELHAAQGELQQALAMTPHSASLQRLLDDTRAQQARLRHLDLDAG